LELLKYTGEDVLSKSLGGENIMCDGAMVCGLMAVVYEMADDEVWERSESEYIGDIFCGLETPY